MTPNSSPALKFELLEADNYSQYLLREPKEIVFVLRQLIQKRAMITAYLDQTNRFLLTTLSDISANERTLYLDTSPTQSLNEEALQARHLLCITQVEKVKIQFQLGQLEQVEHNGYPAFGVPIPQELLRLQRREYYRLAAPNAQPLLCSIPVQNSENRVDARVLDISGGGVAVITPPQGIGFQPQMEFTNCRLELPDFGPISAGLRVCNIFRFTRPDGIEMLRAGCQFVGLTSSMASTIQRYILRTERDRKTRDS